MTGSGDGGSGNGGGTGGGSGTVTCTDHGATVPCYVPGLGYYNDATGCYQEVMEPPPPPGDPLWDGHDPGTGVWLWESCQAGAPQPVWFPTAGRGPTPYSLALMALAKIRLDGPQIHMAPAPGGIGGLVGLPVWMWTPVTPHTWGPISSSASSGALTVRITAMAAKVDWDMGDGVTVTCLGPGSAYVALDVNRPSPDCGHVYARPSFSLPGGVYRITATTTWRVVWSGGGASGVIVTARQSTTTARINEQQVVVE